MVKVIAPQALAGGVDDLLAGNDMAKAQTGHGIVLRIAVNCDYALR